METQKRYMKVIKGIVRETLLTPQEQSFVIRGKLKDIDFKVFPFSFSRLNKEFGK